MSLIVTQITAHGVVHVVDSNITRTDVDPVTGKEVDSFCREDSKVFPVPHLGAGVALAGSYMVGGEKMSIWMPRFIKSTESVEGLTLQSFSEELARWLVNAMTEAEKKDGCLVHVAGHVVDAKGYHPEFWFVRNYESMDSVTGDYPLPSRRFWVSEDFWHRDALPLGQWETILRGQDFRYYVNGPLGARKAYNLLARNIEAILEALWQKSGHGFRRPESIGESVLFAKAYHDLVAAAYVSSRYPAPYVGGETKTFLIPRPGGVASHPLPIPPYPFGARAFD